MDFEAFRALPENAGKPFDQLELEFLQLKQAQITADRQKEADAATEEPAQTNEVEPQKGFVETAKDVVSKLPRAPARLLGMAGGAISGLLPHNWDDIAKEYRRYTLEVEQRLGKDWLNNWSDNLGDLNEATIHILATAAGYTPQAEDETSTEAGWTTGKQLSTGAIAGTAAIIASPIDAAYSRPADVGGFLASGLLRIVSKAKAGNAKAKMQLDMIARDKGKSQSGTGMRMLRSIVDTPVPGIPGMRAPKKRVPLEVGRREAFQAELRQMGPQKVAANLADEGAPVAPAVVRQADAVEAPVVTTPQTVARVADEAVPDQVMPLEPTAPKQPAGQPLKPFEAIEGTAPLTVGDLTTAMLQGAVYGLPFGTIKPALYAPLVRYLWGVAEGTPAFHSGVRKLRQFFGSPAAQALLSDEQQLRQIMREKHKFVALINREGDVLRKRADDLTPDDYKNAFEMRGDFPIYELRRGESSMMHPTLRQTKEAFSSIHRIADPELQRRKLGIQPGDKTPISRVLTRREEAAKLQDIKRKPVEVQVANLGKEGKRAMRNIQSLMDDVNIGRTRQLEFQASIFDALQDGSSLLMSETLRNRLVSQVLDQVKPKPAEAARIAGALQKNLIEKFQKPIRVVQTEAQRHFARTEPGTLKFEGGPTISLDSALNATMKGLKPKELVQIRNEVVSRIIRQAADEASRAAFLKAMKQETRRRAHAGVDESIRTGKGAISVASYADGLVLSHVIEGAPINQVIPRGMSPFKLAESVRAQRQNALREAANRAGRDLTPDEVREITTRIDDTANKLERYEEFTDKSDMFLPEEDMFPTVRIEQEMANMDPANLRYNPNAMYVSPGFNATVGWNQMSRATEGALWDGLSSFNTFIKGNLTVHNPVTHLGNYTSNVGLTSLIHGRTPMRMVLESTNEARKYINYKKGKPVSQMDARTYKALDTTKMAKSDLVHAELGLMDRMGASQNIPYLDNVVKNSVAPLGKVWRAYDNAMKEGYKWGDQSFKIYEASRSFRELAHAVDVLADGEYMRFQTSPTAYTTIHKSGGKIYRGKEVLSTEKMDRMLAAVASKRAMDLFVDYSQVPGLLIALRRMGPLSIASPFITWFWRVQDLPGKKGLIYRTLVDDPLYSTNSPSLKRQNALDALYRQARRMMLYQGGRNTLHEERDLMRNLTKFMGMPYGRGLFFNSENPGYFTYKRLNNTDYFAPGLHAARVLTGFIARDMQSQDYESLTPSQKHLVNRYARGEVGTMKDVLTMVGLAGGPIMEQVTQAMTGRNRYGGKAHPSEMVRNFMPVLMGQLPYKAVDTALNGLGIWNEDTLLSQRFYSQSPKDPDSREDFGPWVFRMLVGLGWRDASAANRTRSFIKRVRDDMKHNLNGELKKRVKQLQQIGKYNEADELTKVIEANLDRIDFEAEQMWAEAENLERALQTSERVRVSDDMEEEELMGGFQ